MSTLHVLDVERAAPLEVAISRVPFGGLGGVAWIDNQSFVYNRLREQPGQRQRGTLPGKL